MATKRITAEIVEKLADGDQVWDSEVRGFGIRKGTSEQRKFLPLSLSGERRLAARGRVWPPGA